MLTNYKVFTTKVIDFIKDTFVYPNHIKSFIKDMANKAGDLTFLLRPKCNKTVGKEHDRIEYKMCSCCWFHESCAKLSKEEYASPTTKLEKRETLN